MIDSFSGSRFFLSNFFEHNGWTVEHHFQAAKTDNPGWVKRILDAPTPALAKRYGRVCPIRLGWDDHKVPVMTVLLRQKFSNPALAKRLVDTGDDELIEGNHWGDTYWGVCNGIGENWLGVLLMQTRDMLNSDNTDVDDHALKIFDDVADQVRNT